MGMPMRISMALQALYNVVDSIFVANMQGTGALANLALTVAFPVQIMIIVIGVGTGVLQALGYAVKPLIISLLRLVVFVFPIAYLFTLSPNVIEIV